MKNKYYQLFYLTNRKTINGRNHNEGFYHLTAFKVYENNNNDLKCYQQGMDNLNEILY